MSENEIVSLDSEWEYKAESDHNACDWCGVYDEHPGFKAALS